MTIKEIQIYTVIKSNSITPNSLQFDVTAVLDSNKIYATLYDGQSNR